MSGVRELLEKEDKGLLLAKISSFWERERQGIHADCLWGMERVHETDDLIAAGQKTADWLITVTFPAKV